MDKICNNCEYWVPTSGLGYMPNWGNCRRPRGGVERSKEKIAGGILRRCDENCRDFTPRQKTYKRTKRTGI